MKTMRLLGWLWMREGIHDIPTLNKRKERQTHLHIHLKITKLEKTKTITDGENSTNFNESLIA